MQPAFSVAEQVILPFLVAHTTVFVGSSDARDLCGRNQWDRDAERSGSAAARSAVHCNRLLGAM